MDQQQTGSGLSDWEGDFNPQAQVLGATEPKD